MVLHKTPKWLAARPESCSLAIEDTHAVTVLQLEGPHKKAAALGHQWAALIPCRPAGRVADVVHSVREADASRQKRQRAVTMPTVMTGNSVGRPNSFDGEAQASAKQGDPIRAKPFNMEQKAFP